MAFFILPSFLLPFTYGMPVIQTTSFTERVVFYLIAFIIIIFTTYLTALKEGIRASRKMIVGNVIGILIFIALLVFGNATWGLNTFGILIKTLPNMVYENKVEVIESKANGSRYKSQFFSFQDTKTGKLSTLEISDIMFNYNKMPKVQLGDSLVLKGKENLFGAYIEELTVYPKNEKTRPFILNIAMGNYIFILPALFILGLAVGIYFIIVKPNLPLVRRNLELQREKERQKK